MGASGETDSVEPKAKAYKGRLVSPKDIDSPHPMLSEVPSSTLSPQSIDQAQNRTPRAASPPPPGNPQPVQVCCTLHLPMPGLALVLSPSVLPRHLRSSYLRTAPVCPSVPVLAARESSFLGPFL